jgi:hypothetical protein
MLVAAGAVSASAGLVDFAAESLADSSAAGGCAADANPPPA